MRSFYQTLSQFLEGPPSRGRSEVTNDTQFASLLRRLRGNLEEVDSLDGNSATDSRVPLSQMYTHNVGHSFFYSHPKLRRLEEIVLNHFKSDQSSSSTVQTTFSPSGSLQKGGSVHLEATRVMIFSQYRDSVKEIATMLSRHSPLVRVMSFVGQASSGKSTKGLTQKEQLQVVKFFNPLSPYVLDKNQRMLAMHTSILCDVHKPIGYNTKIGTDIWMVASRWCRFKMTALLFWLNM